MKKYAIIQIFYYQNPDFKGGRRDCFRFICFCKTLKEAIAEKNTYENPNFYIVVEVYN